MDDLPANKTQSSGLPLALGPAMPRPSLARSAPMAAFVSQVIATSDRNAPPRPRYNGVAFQAIGAYGRTAAIGQRRMPAGYRKTVLA